MAKVLPLLLPDAGVPSRVEGGVTVVLARNCTQGPYPIDVDTTKVLFLLEGDVAL